MNLLRRTFLKAIAASPLAFLLPTAETPIVVANKTEPLQEWEGSYATEERKQPPVHSLVEVDPSVDGAIVAMQPFHGSLIIACQWSVWQIDEGPDGCFRAQRIGVC